jgi:hypothetical protein
MKDLILKIPFIKQAIRQAGIDAFPLAQKDVLDTMRDDLDKQAEELAKKKLNDLLSTVDTRKIVTLNKERGIVFIGGEKAPPERLSALKAEADFVLNSEIWKLLYETPKELAQRTMFVSSESYDDLVKGKAVLFTLSQQKNILDLFSGFIPKK